MDGNFPCKSRQRNPTPNLPHLPSDVCHENRLRVPPAPSEANPGHDEQRLAIKEFQKYPCRCTFIFYLPMYMYINTQYIYIFLVYMSIYIYTIYKYVYTVGGIYIWCVFMCIYIYTVSIYISIPSIPYIF